VNEAVAGLVQRAAAALARRAPAPPHVGVVLGSGLGAVADAVEDPVVVSYEELPGFPRTTVSGHAGQAVLGHVGGVPVAVFQGRAHLYEGGDPDALRVPVRALRAAGASILVLTNAAGSLRPEVGPGSLMAITDHINMTGANLLVGPNDDAIGPRFLALRNAYDPVLRSELRTSALELGIPLAEGVYIAVTGPSFETPAEIRAYRVLGADAVGMSTVQETIIARHSGLRVAAVSMITNLAEGLSGEPLSHEQTLRAAEAGAGDLARLLLDFILRLNPDSQPRTARPRPATPHPPPGTDARR
jgi:xanthosine phosphorylase